MLLREPPALGLAKPARHRRRSLREAARAAGPLQARRPRPGPDLHDVGRRPARRLVRARRGEGLDRLERRGRRLGRPAHARHRLQPPAPRARGARRHAGRLGPGDRRDGRDQPGDRRARPRPRARRSAPMPRSPRSTSATARVVGVTLASGEEIRAPIVASGAHPKTTILDLAGGENFPDEIAEDMRRYRTRGGSVKINMVLSEPPRYEGVTRGAAPDAPHTGVNLCPSIDYLERAWQDCLMGRPAAEPYVEAELPSAIDSSLTDDGRWVMTMFTQYGPPDEEAWAGDARERYADACVEHLARYAPNVPGRDRRARGARAAGPRADLRPAGRLHLPGRAGPGPDGVHAPLAGSLALRDAGARPLPLRRRHPPGRRRDGRRRPQRRPADPPRPAGRASRAAGCRRATAP